MTTLRPSRTNFKNVGRIVQEFVISLIEDHQHLLRHATHKIIDLLLTNHGSGRIIGICNEDLPGSPTDGSKHRVEIVGETRVGHFDRLGSKELRHQGVNGKRVTRGDYLIARAKKRMPDEFNDLIRTIAQNNIFPSQPKFFCDGGAQCPAAAVRVKVGAIESFAHRRHSLRRRAERILVGGQFNDFLRSQSHFARQLFDGFARLIRDKLEDVLVRGLPHKGFQS